MATSLNTCPCPKGYVIDQSGLNCVKTTSVAATNNGVTYTVGSGNRSSVYGQNGVNFYQDISGLTFPIRPVASAPTTLQDASGTVTLAVTNNIVNPLWGDAVVADGRLNNAGIWTTQPLTEYDCTTTGTVNALNQCPINEWIGFSACVDVPVAGTYCIGMAADNETRFSINGQLIVALDFSVPGVGAPTFNFNYWHVFPITLKAGINILTLEGLNQGRIASFAAEVYHATPSQLALITTPAQLSAVTIFTTTNKIGQTFQTGQFSGYSCPSGYALNTCGQELMCSIIESIPYNCCFLITNCADKSLTHVVSTDLSAYVGTGQAITIAEFPGCWSVTTATDCTTTITVSNVVAFDNCQTCAPCFKLTNCITGTIIITSTNLSTSIGMTVNLSGTYAGCWSVMSAPNCTGSVPVTYVSTSDTCISCLPCFKLTNCADEKQTVTTNTVLTAYIGQAVQIEGYPGICWQVSAATGCTQSTPITNPKSFIDCTTCAKKCYVLSDCAEKENPIITDTDLSQYVGQVIQIKGCVNQCWTVNISGTCRGSEPVVVMTSFGTCALCNPPLVCPAPELLRQRKVKPGYNTPGCSPEYTEKVNCEFAEQVYNKMKKRRYGITTCCGEDLQKWIIKKELLDLRAIYDPALCRTCPPITCCTPCPVPTPPTPPTPIACPTPTDITATITLVTPCEDVVAMEGAVITFNNNSTTGITSAIKL